MNCLEMFELKRVLRSDGEWKRLGLLQDVDVG